jgi:hypothetical protein
MGGWGGAATQGWGGAVMGGGGGAATGGGGGAVMEGALSSAGVSAAVILPSQISSGSRAVLDEVIVLAQTSSMTWSGSSLVWARTPHSKLSWETVGVITSSGTLSSTWNGVAFG